jgi:predicted transcriptional regulator
MCDALISIRPIHVRQIISGCKAVEIRRRRLNVPVGTRLWIYSTRPDACVSVVARVRTIEVGSPGELWLRIQSMAGVSEEAFAEYCSGLDVVTAVYLHEVERFEGSSDFFVGRPPRSDIIPAPRVRASRLPSLRSAAPPALTLGPGAR